MRIFETKREAYTPKIRIINLVDILLVLLLFLFVTTTFRVESPSAVKLALPEAKTAEEIGREKIQRLLLSVGPDEQIYLGQDQIDLGQLADALARARAEQPGIVLQFSADKSVSYGRIVAVIDAAREAGIENLTAFTRKSVE